MRAFSKNSNSRPSNNFRLRAQFLTSGQTSRSSAATIATLPDPAKRSFLCDLLDSSAYSAVKSFSRELTRTHLPETNPLPAAARQLPVPSAIPNHALQFVT